MELFFHPEDAEIYAEYAEKKRGNMNRTATLIFLAAILSIAGYAQSDKDFVSTREMDRINWMEFKAVVPSKTNTVLLPTGTLEPHGVMDGHERLPDRERPGIEVEVGPP